MVGDETVVDHFHILVEQVLTTYHYDENTVGCVTMFSVTLTNMDFAKNVFWKYHGTSQSELWKCLNMFSALLSTIIKHDHV